MKPKKENKGLTDAELIAKYGDVKIDASFDAIIEVMVSKPAKNAPPKKRKLSAV